MSEMNRRDFLAGTALGSVGLMGGCAVPEEEAAKPNVVLVMTDDQGYGDLGCHGNNIVRTPRIDNLAKESVEFSRFYVSPVCAPTRSSLLTGRYHLRTNVHGVTAGRETMRENEITLAEALREAGYRTGLFGKWHLGEHYPYVPHAQGFDEFAGFRNGHWNNYFDSMLERNGEPYQTEGYIADACTGEAMSFIDRCVEDERPFFCYLPYNPPHSPFQLPERYYEMYAGADVPGVTKAAYGMCTNIDENMGRLLAKIDEHLLAENTIFIYMTDNGPNGDRYNGGLRGRKGSVYDGGIRVPFYLRFPARFKERRTVDAMAAHIDLFPTILSLCGVEPPEGPTIDGVDVTPLMEGETADWPDRRFFTHWAGREPLAKFPGAVRTDRYSLINGRELYDLKADRGQSNDIAGENPGVVEELSQAYDDWFENVTVEEPARLSIPVGYAQEDPVVLPAHQAYLTGGVKFYEGHGWAHDWITNWRSGSDVIHWDVDVRFGGEYEVSLRYVCGEADLGSTVRVAVGDQSVEGKIDRATPTEPLPMRDTIPRKEAPVMDWGTVVLGRVQLSEGATTLRIQGVPRGGRPIMDLKAVTLAKVKRETA